MSTLNVDIINENTAEAGVTVEGVLIKDSVLKITGGSPGADKVLTSDASGNATWGDAGGGSLTYIDKSVALLDAGVIDFQEKKSSDYLFYLVTTVTSSV